MELTEGLRQAAPSAKAKIAAGIVGIGVTAAAGSAAYLALRDSGEPWEKAYREFLLEEDGVAGFDLNDFDEDGIPELIVLEEDEGMQLYRFDSKIHRFLSAGKSGMVDGESDDRESWSIEHTYGYDLEYDTLLDMECHTITLKDGREGSETFPVYITYKDGETERRGSTSTGYTTGPYPIEWKYYWTDAGSERQEIPKEEAAAHLAEACGRFNEIEFTEVTGKDIEERFAEFKENGNRERRRNKNAETVKEEGGDTESTAKEPAPEDTEQEPEEIKTTLAEADETDLKTLVGLAVMTDYFQGERMSGVFYNAGDLAVNMKFVDMVSLFSITNDFMEETYAKYAPKMEADRDTFERYFEVEEIQSYLKNVFRMEDADLTGYMQGERVLFSLAGEPVYAEVNFGDAFSLSDGAYKISGTAGVLEPGVGFVEDYYPFILTVTPNSESPFGYTMDSLYYGTTGSIIMELEDDQYEAIFQMVHATESACIERWQMSEDFDIYPEEMGILSKLNFAADGARSGWLGEQKEQADIEELAGLYSRVTGDTFSREKVDAQFAEMQAEDAPYTYVYDGTEYGDGTVNLFVHVRTFYGETGSTDRREIEKEQYVCENRTFSSRDGRGILKINDVQRFFRNGNYIGVFGESLAYEVPFAAYLYEDENSPTGYRLHYIHYYISKSPLW